MNFLRAILVSALFTFAAGLPAAVTVNINSGNPKWPFPQFQDYGNGRATLASHNAPGVTHAEMEQRIRDAWAIMSNRMNYTGVTLNGRQYIKYTSSPDCTEGDGYSLIAAAYMGDKDVFDGLWLQVHDNRMNLVTSYGACPTILGAGGKAYGKLPSVPTTFIIDKKGNISETLEGSQPKAEFLKAIKRAMK